jgi:hypothetical protein
VLLETSKTDEYGKARHQERYVLKMRLKQAIFTPAAKLTTRYFFSRTLWPLSK